LDEDLLRDSADGATELPEAEGPAGQVVEDRRLPASVQDAGRALEIVEVHAFEGLRSMRHALTFW